MKTLNQIFDKYKCDKGSSRHRYDRVYEPGLKHLKDEEFNLLEIGILRGTSLEVWLEYFPNAYIAAIDIFKRVPSKDVSVLKNPRVHWCNCDSLKGPNEDFKNMVEDRKFDVIIDDGLHFHDSQRKTFDNFISYLSDDGVYFIEDVWAFDKMTAQQKRHRWMLKNPKHYSDKLYTSLLNSINKYDVRYHDLRKNFEPDTFIIEIRK